MIGGYPVGWISWDGGGGDFNWNNAASWSADTLPGAADDVAIDSGANDFTIVHSGGSTTVHSLSNLASLAVTGGQLFLSDDSTVAGELELTNGATLGGSADLIVSGEFTWTNGTLQGVAGQGSLTAVGGTSITGWADLSGG